MVRKALNDEDTLGILTDGTWGSLATYGEEYPYTLPMSYVVCEGCIYFHSKPVGQKVQNILRDGRVCFNVVNISKMVQNINPCNASVRYSSAQVFGRATLVDDEQEKLDVLEMFADKYSAVPDRKPVGRESMNKVAVLRLEISYMEGKANID